MMKKELIHVGYISNICDFAATLPFELMPGFILRKAKPPERDFISAFLKGYAGDELNPHEYRWNFTHGRGAFRLEDKEQWRYHVIEFPADFPWIRLKQKDHRKLAISDIFFDAACVSDANLHCHMVANEEPEIRRNGPPVTWSPQQLANLHSLLAHELEHGRSIRNVSKSDLLDMKLAFEHLKNLSSTQLLIRDVITRYQQSFGVHADSPLRILAQFGTIELLISHKPASSESGDSLSHQLRTKLPLLAKRFSRPLTPSDFFGFEGKAKTKEWDNLYDLRSRIAHNGPRDIDECIKAHKFGSPGRVSYFLDEFTRRLIRQALVEPQLFIDLKEC